MSEADDVPLTVDSQTEQPRARGLAGAGHPRAPGHGREAAPLALRRAQDEAQYAAGFDRVRRDQAEPGLTEIARGHEPFVAGARLDPHRQVRFIAGSAESGAAGQPAHHRPHDAELPWGSDGLDAVLSGIREVLGDPDARVSHVGADLADPEAAGRVVAATVSELGRPNAVVVNHARSGGDASLSEVTPEMLDGHWAVDARSSILLTQAFTAHHVYHTLLRYKGWYDLLLPRAEGLSGDEKALADQAAAFYAARNYLDAYRLLDAATRS